jgi:hypothetical protein
VKLARTQFDRLLAHEGLDPNRFAPADRRPLVAGAA